MAAKLNLIRVPRSCTAIEPLVLTLTPPRAAAQTDGLPLCGLGGGALGGVVGGPLCLSFGSSGARIHSTMRPPAITKLVRADRPVPDPQPPPSPGRSVSRKRALTYGPRRSVEISLAPQGSVALAAS